MTLALVLALSLAAPQTAAEPQKSQPKTSAQPKAPGPTAAKDKAAAAEKTAADTLRTQVMLDRAGFSPGPIDGRVGSSTKKALEAFQKQAGDAAPQTIEPTTRYRITAEDTAGPFVDIPKDLVEQSKLPQLGYRSIVEALAERFHSTPAFLQQLNPGAKFTADEEIVVPNVEPLVMPTPQPKPTPQAKPQAARGRGREGREGAGASATGTTGKPDVVVTVSKAAGALTVTDPSGRVLLYAPVTTGSEQDPLPIGEWKVNGVSLNPTFNYNPKLFWDANPAHSKAKIPAGPNNPVGLVWIDLSKEHYGIHGSPEPTTVGKTASHGCVRLTNWDAIKLAGMVKPGTRVVFTQ
jgi:lipoprotein-anchoring transpeptidase ErfK/SrfK